MKNWKTTVNGILAFMIATLTTLLAFQAPAALQQGADRSWLYITAGANLLLALCRAWVGLLQTDAPAKPVIAPGTYTTGAKLGVWMLIALLLPATMLMGCPSQQNLSALVTVLGNASASIAALEGNTALAAKLKTDTAAAASAVTNWKKGSAATEVIEALNLVEADLDLIPGTSQYAPLVDLAIGTVESILEIVQPGSSSPNGMTARPGVTHRYVLKSPPKSAAQFKKEWNQLAAGPLAKAQI